MIHDEKCKEFLRMLEADRTISNPIISAYRGSIAHNMYIPNTDPNSIDDIDLVVVCAPPIQYYFGLQEFGSRGTIEIKDNEMDLVVYEFRKTIQMLLNSNPNILSLLWLRPEHYLHVNSLFRWMIEERDLFSSKKAFGSFIGYATNQMNRMQTHAFEGYMGEKRKGLVDKFGYDPKMAAHLIRLMKMCIEFLETGQLNVYRDNDQDILLDIKLGRWSLDRVKDYAETLFSASSSACLKSRLKEKPDIDAIENRMVTSLYQLTICN